MRKTKLLTAVLSIAALTSLTSCGSSGFQDGTIKIGVTGPLTGGAASYGLGVKNAAEMAVSEINDAGGVNGKKLSFEAADDVLKAKNAELNFDTLYEKGMQISLGAVTSGAATAFGNKAKDKVFCLTPSASSDEVPTTGIYQMCFADSNQGTKAAEYVKTLGDIKVGVFYDSSDSYSTGILTKFKAEYGADITEASFSSKNNEKDFTNQVQALKDCKFIFLPIYYTEASIFITKAKSVMATDAMFYGCDGLDGIASVDGFDATQVPQKISYLSHFNAKSTEETTVKFVTNYTKKYGTTTLNQFAASAYDCIYAIAQAMVEIEDDGIYTFEVTDTAETFKTYLDAKFQGGFTFEKGVTGSGEDITWNADRTVDKTATKYDVN